MERLIVGTIPPWRFCNEEEERPIHRCDVRWFYGSRKNEFWSILETITGEHFVCGQGEGPVQQRMDFLQHRIGTGIMDIIQSCDRDEESAEDSALTQIEFQPIHQYLADREGLQLVFTSRQAGLWVGQGLRDMGHSARFARNGRDSRNPLLKTDLGDFECYELISPSPSAFRRLTPDPGLTKSQTRINQWRQVFGFE